MEYKPFSPAAGQTVVVANSTSASSDIVLPPDCDQVVFYNSSASAIAFFRFTSFPTNALGTAVAPTATTDMPVPPGALIRVTAPPRFKEVRVIASAADGNLYITPGNGN